MIQILSTEIRVINEGGEVISRLMTSQEKVKAFMFEVVKQAEIERNKAQESGIFMGKKQIKERVAERLMIIAKGINTL